MLAYPYAKAQGFKARNLVEAFLKHKKANRIEPFIHDLKLMAFWLFYVKQTTECRSQISDSGKKTAASSFQNTEIPAKSFLN